MRTQNPTCIPTTNRGFALIVTLSLMILLTVIAVGLLTLSSISLRSASRAEGMTDARANARMALMLAIGNLQRSTGPDTRITARADVLDESNPPVFGAWKSWQGDDHESSGRPISPGNYKSQKENRFLQWLVSGDPVTLPDTSAGDGKAALVSAGSVGQGTGREKLQIHLEPSLINPQKPKGAFAWWVSGENTKAHLPKPYKPSSNSIGQWAAAAKSHSVADPESFGMNALLSDPSPAEKGISLAQTDLFSQAGTLPTSREHFHDLSTSSVGLLTNVATGGWKKDFSLLTENWSKAGTRGLPFFRVKPGQDILSSLPTSSSVAASNSILYPWSSYRGNSNDIPTYQHGAVSSWENLNDWILMYKKISTSGSGRASIAPASFRIDENTPGGRFGFLHKVRILPVIARIQWVFSHYAQQLGKGGSYEARLLVTPVITMWNPYNVEFNFSNVPVTFRIPKSLPAALKYTVGGLQGSRFNSLTAGATNNLPSLSTSGGMEYKITSRFNLMPGETRVFSPASTTPESADKTLTLQPGYRSRGGHYYSIKNDSNQSVTMPGAAEIVAEAVFNTTYDDKPANSSAPGNGVGIYLDMLFNNGNGNGRHLAYRMIYTPSVANSVYPPAGGLGKSTLGQVASNPVPFLTTVFGARMASKTHLAAKGFVQSSPLVNYTAMGGKDLTERTIARHYGGTNHPVNSPFDYSFEKVSPLDSLLPNDSDTTGRGYIVTGFTKADGLSRCVIAELPTRPVQSLAELQSWDMRYENPIPPFAFNLIGNSDATPLLPADAVVNRADAGLSTNLQHDDSYCANHLLFDDWFFSSITPNPTNFGTSGKSQRETFIDFVSGSAPLGNRAYRALVVDVARAAVSASNASQLFQDHVDPSDSWKTIASRLEVEGMFNVNSTSVTAWRALLGHARNQKVPYISESGGSWNVDLSGEIDHAFSRFSVAGDVEATESGSSGSFPEAAEFAGYRILNGKILDALATEIVEQVRLRGPFLSLSEFVNRQLSSGDLALAGTIQAALNEIAKKNSTNPYAEIESVIPRLSLANPAAGGDAEYQFPDAAVGQSTYGLPGWTRQADVLRPLAPILTARDDTFTIRAYGDSRNAAGDIIASAVCEAVVRRTRNYVDSTDAAESTGAPVMPVNLTFGRQYELISFRWLSPSEI